MRPNQQNKNRSRGRNNGGRKHNNPLSRNFESNGPDVKIRGNASHIAEKYVQLARDAQASGDSVMAENYLQHAEHYFRILSAAQPQQQPRNDANSDFDDSDDSDSENDSAGDFNDNQRENTRGSRRDRNRDNRNRRDNNDRDDSGDNADGESEKAPAAAQASEADGSDESNQQQGEAKPKRERRPRRRKQAETTGEGGGDEATVGELPAFLTGTSAAE